MKKLKLSDLHQYGTEVLTKEQMKIVLGGVLSYQCPMGHAKCVSNSDCGTYQACKGINGCCDSGRGDKCTGDSDCGNGLACVTNPYGAGKWCN